MTNQPIFTHEVAERLEAVYRTPEIVAQRQATLRAVSPRPGDRILDVGAGPGGSSCSTWRLVSSEMLTVAEHHRTSSAHADHIAVCQGDATELPFADESFDALTSTQVYEYVQDVDQALTEAHRVLRPGRGLLMLDTDWDSLVWHARDGELMHRIIDAWTERFADPTCPPRYAASSRPASPPRRPRSSPCSTRSSTRTPTAPGTSRS